MISKLANGVKLTRKVDQANLYAEWFGGCLQDANALKAAGASWRDWNGLENAWRVVDAPLIGPDHPIDWL